MSNWVRGLVSKKKRRIKEGGYDLDMAYIGKRILAMGFPAQGFEAFYRNDFGQVKRYLDEKHGDNYFVYNLCSERDYDRDIFDGRVEKFPFDDHSPPKFDLMRQFCIHAQNWLDEDKKHIIAVHCKAGKGRTGLMIVCLLLHMGRFESCDEALTYYGKKRTYNGKGVTIPSQIRYAYYYEQYLKGGFPRDQEFVGKPCTVTCVHFRNVPDEFFTRDLILEICAIDDETIYYKGPGKNPKGPRKNSEHNTLTYKLDGLEECENIAGDFRISIFKGEKMACFMWFNSEFIKDKEVFTKAQIDKANKNKVFKKDFKACVFAHH